MKPVAAAILLLALVACGSASDNVLLTLGTTLKETVQKKDRPTMAQQRAAVVQTVRNANATDPVLMIELPSRHAVASLVVGGRNDGAVSWYDATGVSVTTRNGVVISTRGLGFDLMASDMRGTLSAIAGRTGSYGRLHRYLDGEGQLQRVTYSCRTSRDGARITENCSSGSETFTNIYHVNGGSVTRSRQWIGPGIGYADLTRLQ